MNNEELQTIAQSIGKNYNYPDVEAKFVETREFKITWQRSYQWISMQVSDYMQNAPAEVIEELLDTTFGKIVGRDSKYGPLTVNFIESPAFVKANQPVYLRRTRASYDARVKESYDRLKAEGLVEDRDDLAFSSRVITLGVPGTSSMTMKSVTVNADLVDTAPEDVLDLVVLILTRNACRRMGSEKVPTKMLAMGLENAEERFERLHALGFFF